MLKYTIGRNLAVGVHVWEDGGEREEGYVFET